MGLRTRGHFLAGDAGPLFLTEHAPASATPRHALVVVPAFAEEMNKSRRMYTLLAARLAQAGTVTLVLDPYGTGDSGGDFADARWELWLRDLAAALAWVGEHHRGLGISLLGHRTGAVLAMQAAAAGGIQRLLLWQPVFNGRQFLTQLLRVVLAGAMTGESAAAGESTKSLRARFDAGETVEVAGYAVAAELALALDRLKLDTVQDLPLPPVCWYEVVAAGAAELPPARLGPLEALRAAGREVQLQTVVGEPFWSLQEITDVPDLVEATAQGLPG